MRPSQLSRQDCDIYLLAVEFRTLDCKAMDHCSFSGGQRSRRSGVDPRLAWAIDYLSHIPRDGAELIDKAHKDGDLTWRESRRCTPYLRAFYRAILRRKLYDSGEYWLRVINS